MLYRVLACHAARHGTSSWWSCGKSAPKSSDIQEGPDVQSFVLHYIVLFRGSGMQSSSRATPPFASFTP